MDNKELFAEAQKAKQNSYSPYSNYKVGAALLTKSGKVFHGCNVENCAYGPSNCAERTAIFSAIANGEKDFVSIAISSQNDDDFCFPCGVCRQVLTEFNPEIKVVLSNKNEIKTFKAKDLLPHYFKI